MSTASLELRARDPRFGGKTDIFYRAYLAAGARRVTTNIPDGSLFVVHVAAAERLPYDGQSVLISHSGHDWKHGDFSYSFSQLSQITKDYEALDIDVIERILAGEQKRTGDSFEALGIKFPADNTTRWGIIVVIGIQAYFWIHLFGLSPKIRRSDPGFEVAWIGMYSSQPARLAMFVTTCLLPLAAVATLGIRGLYLASFARNYWAYLSVGLGLTLLFGLLAWRRMLLIHEIRQ